MGVENGADLAGLAAVIVATGGIITAIIVPLVNGWIKKQERQFELRMQEKEKENESRFNKIELEDRIRFEKDKSKLREVFSRLYGYMWKLLLQTEADRVYIIQPHPLSDKQFISVSLEVLNPDRDVRPQKDNFQYKKISEWAGFISKLSTEDWLVYKDPEHIKDLKFRLEFKRRGLSSFVSRRMTDEDGNWEGTLCVEYTHIIPQNLDYIKGKMMTKSELIADILPEYKPFNEEE